MPIPEWVASAALVCSSAVLVAWNLAVGARVATVPQLPAPLRTLTALAAFLVIPALVIALLAMTPPGARVLAPLAPLWPATSLAVFFQTGWALRRGGRERVGVAVVLLYNALVAWVALTVWADGAAGPLSPQWMAPGYAWALAASNGDATWLAWLPLALVPVLAPLSPARRPAARAGRVLVGLSIVLLLAGVMAALPRAVAALGDIGAPPARSSEPRAHPDLAIGVQLFGELHGVPSGAVARHDVALAESLAVTAAHVQLGTDGATTATLDSIARALEPRRDSVTLVVTLVLGRDTLASDDAWRVRREVLQRIVRRLHPDVLVPAERVPRGVDPRAWRRVMEQTVAGARRVDPEITVALAIGGTTATDSALADWVLTTHPAVDALALVPSHTHALRAFDAMLSAVARWASFSNAPSPVWLLGVPSAPLATGEVAQMEATRHALAWSAAQPYVRGVIAGEASDTHAPRALRSAAGRSRLALADVGAALRTVRDLPAVPRASSASPPDSVSPARATIPDTLSPPSR